MSSSIRVKAEENAECRMQNYSDMLFSFVTTHVAVFAQVRGKQLLSFCILHSAFCIGFSFQPDIAGVGRNRHGHTRIKSNAAIGR